MIRECDESGVKLHNAFFFVHNQFHVILWNKKFEFCKNAYIILIYGNRFKWPIYNSLSAHVCVKKTKNTIPIFRYNCFNICDNYYVQFQNLWSVHLQTRYPLSYVIYLCFSSFFRSPHYSTFLMADSINVKTAFICSFIRK